MGMGGRDKEILSFDAGGLLDGLPITFDLRRKNLTHIHADHSDPGITQRKHDAVGLQIIQEAFGETGDIVTLNADAQRGINIDGCVAYLKLCHREYLRYFSG